MRRLIAIWLILSAVTLAAYWPTTRHEFLNFDDPEYVVKNDHVQAGITAQSIRWAFTTLHASNWHPVTWLSHMLDCQLFGLAPGAHHAVGLGFHLANTLLLFLVLRRMTGAVWRSAFVAALFALHPMHVESVAWISERKDVLSTFFALLTLWSYTSYVKRPEAGNPPSALRPPPSDLGLLASALRPLTSARYWLVLVFFALGLMSKQMLVTLPLILLLLDFWPLARVEDKMFNGFTGQPVRPGYGRSIKSLILEKWPFFALACAASVMTFIAQNKAGNVEPFDRWPLEIRIANAFVSYCTYVEKAFWPTNLAFFYPSHKMVPWQAILAALLLTGISVAAYRRARSRPYFFVGWFWFLVMLLPVIGLVQLGDQAMADRYTYLPFVGLFIAVTWWIGDALPYSRSWRIRVAAGAAACAVLLACGAATQSQLKYWQNSLTLFGRSIEVTPRNALAHCYLGAALLDSGKTDQAAGHFRTALEIFPNYAYAYNYLGAVFIRKGNLDGAIAHFQRAAEILPGRAEFHNNLGISLLQKGRVDEAIAQLRTALEIQPDSAKGYDNLGTALLQTHQLDEAIANFEKGLGLHPGDANAQQSLGSAYLQKHQVDDAIVHFRKAQQIQPSFTQAHIDLGDALLQKGQLDEAIVQFQMALELQTNSSYILNNLAWIRAANAQERFRNGAEAVRLAERACQVTDYKVPLMIGTLAAAYAEAGRFDDAMAAAERARDLALALGRKEVAEKNTELIQLFKTRQPYHEPAQ